MKMVLALPCLYFMVSIFFTTVFWIHVKSLGGRVQSLFERKRAIWFFSFFIHVGSFWNVFFILSPIYVGRLAYSSCYSFTPGISALHRWQGTHCIQNGTLFFCPIWFMVEYMARMGLFFGRILSLWCNRYITRVAIEKQARLHKTHTKVTIHKSALRAKHSARSEACGGHLELVNSHPVSVILGEIS